MQRVFPLVMAITLVITSGAFAQRSPLKTEGWGSISGKVTLEGDVPAVLDLTPKMMQHNDKPCCLAPTAKPIEKVDMTWVVDPKTKGVANIIVWVTPPKGMYFAIHNDYKTRKDHVAIDQPHCQFLPRVSVYNPVYFDGKDEVPTGQKFIVKNSSTVAHNTRATGTMNGFNITLPAKTEVEKVLAVEKLPVTVQCDLHPWMGARVLVLDHPYYAVTKEDGSYKIPHVPAGAKISFIAWHEAKGYVSRQEITVKDKENAVVDFKVAK